MSAIRRNNLFVLPLFFVYPTLISILFLNTRNE